MAHLEFLRSTTKNVVKLFFFNDLLKTSIMLRWVLSDPRVPPSFSGPFCSFYPGGKVAKTFVDRQYIPQLDGLRAFAVFLVLLSHGLNTAGGPAILKAFAGFGGLGVQLFFILSGYLITGILLHAKNEQNYFKNFYARRGLRIWPLYYAILAIAFLTMPFARAYSDHPNVHVSFAVYVFYLQNIVYGHARVPAILGPTWSLAVEEQFYLVWPLLVRFVSKRALIRVCIFLILAVPVFRMFSLVDTWNTLCQLDALAIGALFACYRDSLLYWKRFAGALLILLPAGVTMQLISGDGVLSALGIAKTILVYGSAALLLRTLDDSSWFAAVFRNRFLCYVGKVSYGVYLFNSTLFAALFALLKHSSKYRLFAAQHAVLAEIIQFFAGCALVIAVAGFSYRYFEKPFLNMKRFFIGSPVDLQAKL